jgi:hypothetical protein
MKKRYGISLSINEGGKIKIRKLKHIQSASTDTKSGNFFIIFHQRLCSSMLNQMAVKSWSHLWELRYFWSSLLNHMALKSRSYFFFWNDAIIWSSLLNQTAIKSWSHFWKLRHFCNKLSCIIGPVIKIKFLGSWRSYPLLRKIVNFSRILCIPWKEIFNTMSVLCPKLEKN